MAASPTVARLSASHAALSRWAHEPDRSGATAPARAAFLAKFELEVDPEGRLDPDERRRRAVTARKAHMVRLALGRAVAREAKKSATGTGKVQVALDDGRHESDASIAV